MKRIYLDHASLTPLDKRVFKAMKPYLKNKFANPSALYQEGRDAKKTVSECREKIARLLNTRAEEMIFTASGSEADNLALLGVFEAFKNKFKSHFITTNIEHPAVLETFKKIEKDGGEVTYVPVEKNGIVDPAKIKAVLKENTVLVSVMLANNEIGTIQPIRDISRILQEYKKTKQDQSIPIPYLHTDASQAANYIDLSFQKLGVDMMTLDAIKMYGPSGVGLLAVKKYVALTSVINGGGQERGLRAGTENVAGIVGFTEALVLTQKLKEKESARLTQLREYFFDTVMKALPNVVINGDRTKRLPNNVNICVPGLDAEFAVIKLDREGIAASAASSCLNLREDSHSYVINALGDDGKKCSQSSLRFTFGRSTKKKHLNLTLTKLHDIIHSSYASTQSIHNQSKGSHQASS